jgi:two-component system, NarL family, sensor histidine kinase DesK
VNGVEQPGVRDAIAGRPFEDLDEWSEDQRKWARGWRSLIFPGFFLLYLGQVLHGVGIYSSGWPAAIGLVGVVGFGAAYLGAIRARSCEQQRRLWVLFGVMVALLVVEVPIARNDAFVMCVFIGVLAVSVLGPRAIGIIIAMAVSAAVVPALVPTWDSGVDVDMGVTIILVSLAMFAFFGLMQANRELSSARSEVARLAAESERSRIARDLHDLLGHSLTTITIKAGLARRLSATDAHRAAVEIAEVEDIARRSLADVRAAVSGYREVSLAGELATAGEVLRAAGIAATLPRSVEHIDGERQALFGWVVREGVTNVVRHARATSCTISVGPDWVEVADDGRSTIAVPGNGLTGLGERVEAVGGRVLAGPWARGDDTGWRLRVDVSRAGSRPSGRTGSASRASPRASEPTDSVAGAS